ncbi:DUF1833 family protein [Vibrio sp. 1408]|uniref:DUF1833 family protein n=1 Tax=Vibrio sp. 1408 TaxID=3074557 RepID=UPI002966C743|nr:DUF1833 family protein [Vibrio sp. 1408]MDW3050495.1 DUF1833 family protein [Vibrio sp. 1408]
MILSTIEYQHPTLPGGVLRYVKDGIDLYAGIESGEMVLFTAGQFAFQLPDKATKGQEALTVAAPNTDLTLAKAIETAKRHEPVIPVVSIYREYDTDDLSQPRNKRIRLTMTSAKITTMTVTLTNTWKDLTNRRFMRRLYTTKTHPGLKYL